MDMTWARGGGSRMPLNDSGVDFTNKTQAFNFLQEILDDTYLQVYGEQAASQFRCGAVVVIGVAGIWNVLWRIRASQARRPPPAKPRNSFTKTLATATAIGREVSYLQPTRARAAFWVRVPPVGVALVVVAYLAFILALEFTGPDVAGAQHDQNLLVRAGWLTVAQIPLVVLLAGKNNLIELVASVTFTTGVLLGLAGRVAAAATAPDESGRPLLPLRVLHFVWVVKKRAVHKGTGAQGIYSHGESFNRGASLRRIRAIMCRCF